MTADLDDVIAADPGDAFEDRCFAVLRRIHRPQCIFIIPSTMGGDYGIEGFTACDRTAYQCYADRNSVSLRQRTDKQKSKLTEDTSKLQKNRDQLSAVLGPTVLDHYILFVPQYHAGELLAHAAARTAVVQGWGLPFVSPTFRINVKRPEDYPEALLAALRDDAVKALIPEPGVDAGHVDLFAQQKPELVGTLEAKCTALVADEDLPALRDRFISAFLAKKSVMESLENEWPDSFESVERVRRQRQALLEFESALSPDDSGRRVLSLISSYQIDLETGASGITSADAQRLALGQTAEWLMHCPLRFPNTDRE